MIDQQTSEIIKLEDEINQQGLDIKENPKTIRVNGLLHNTHLIPAFGGKSEGDTQMIKDLNSEMTNDWEDFSKRFRHVEVHASGK